MTVIGSDDRSRQLRRLQLERSLLVSPDTYPGQTVCAVCDRIWFEHKGEVCPANVPGQPFVPASTVFVPLLQCDPQFDI